MSKKPTKSKKGTNPQEWGARKKRGLTPLQRRFAEEYLVDLNATEAYVRAGGSAKTANVQGPRLLRNEFVAAIVEALQAERSKRTEITQDMVLKELWQLASVDMADYMTLRGGFAIVDFGDLAPGATK